MAKIHFDITADNSEFLSKVKGTVSQLHESRNAAEKAGVSFSELGKRGGEAGDAIDKAFKKIAAGTALLFSVDKIKDFIGEIVNVRKEFQSLEISFSTLLGSDQLGKKMFADITQFATSTPMLEKDLAKAAQTMLGFNIEAEKVMPLLQQIGDISMGDSQKFQSLALAFSQASSTGKLMGQDLLQMINAGFNPLVEISRTTGRSMADLKDAMSKGEISVDMLEGAFKSATSEGGKFNGMLESMSHTMEGAFSNLEGAFQKLYNDMGQSMESAIVPAVTAATDAVNFLAENWSAVGTAIMGVIEAVGIYKGMELAIAASDRATAALAYSAEKEALEALLVVKEAEKKTDIEEAVANGSLSETRGKEVMALREQAQAQLEVLASKEAVAKKNYELATTEAALASANLDAAQESYDAAEKAYEVALQTGDARRIDAAAIQLDTAETELNTAATELNASRKKVSATSSELDAASKTKSAFAAEVDAASQTKDAIATGILAKAKAGLSKVVQFLNGTMLANPYFAVAAAIAVAATAVYKLATEVTKADEAQKRLADSAANCTATVEKERIQIDDLFDDLKRAEKGTMDYENAKNKIIEQYGAYLKGLGDEIESLRNVEAAYKAVTKAAEKSARARAMETASKNATEAYGSSFEENVGRIYDALDKKVGHSKAKEYVRQLREDLEKTGQVSRDTAIKIQSAVRGSGEWIKEINDARKILDSEMTKIRDMYGDDDTKKEVEEEKKNLNDAYNEAKKKYRNAANWLKTIDKNKQDYTPEERAKAEEDLKKAEEAFKKLGGQTDKQRTAANNRATKAEEQRNKALADQQQKYNDIILKQEEEFATKREQIALQTQQARIDQMKEGGAKTLAQIKLDYEKQKATIDLAEGDMLRAQEETARKRWEAQNPGANKNGQNWENTGYHQWKGKTGGAKLSDEQSKLLEEQRNAARVNYERAIREEQEARQQSLYDYLKEYGSMEEQRLAIAKEYEQKIAKAKDEIEEEALRRKMKDELDALNSQDVFESIRWDDVFTDLTGKTKEYLTYLKENLQELLESNKLSNIADIEKVQQKIDELNAELSKKGGIFNFKGEYASERERLQSNANNASNALGQAMGERALAEMNLKILKEQGASADKLRIAESKLAQARQKVTDASKKAKDAEQALATTLADKVAGVLSDFVNSKFFQNLEELPEIFNKVGLGDAGEKIGQGLSGVNNAAGAAADFASRNYIGGLSKSISAIQDFGHALGVGGGNADEVNRITEQNTQAIEKLSGRLDLLSDALKDANGVKAVEITRDMIKVQEEINRLSTETLQAQMGYHSAHHSNDYYASDAEVKKLYEEGVARASKLSGVEMAKNIKGIGDVESMTPEQLNAIRTYMPELWEYLTTVGKYDKSEYWDAVADQAGAVDKMVEELNNKLTMTSFDSLRSSWLDTLSDMESSAEDFAKSFEDMMYKSMLNSWVLDDDFDKWLESWQERWAKAVENNDKNALKNLQDESDKKRAELITKRDKLAATMGYDRSASSQQEATANGIKSITADQADQLVGRITAMQIAVEASKTANITNGAGIIAGINSLVNAVNSITMNNGILDDIRTAHATANSHLENLVKQTKAIYTDFKERLDSIKTNTAQL